MPYIKKVDRKALDEFNRPVLTPGDLNYVITRELTVYWKIKGHSYQTINDIIGALEGAKLEFYRRIAVPYEDTKIVENGDVY